MYVVVCTAQYKVYSTQTGLRDETCLYIDTCMLCVLHSSEQKATMRKALERKCITRVYFYETKMYTCTCVTATSQVVPATNIHDLYL